MRVVYARCDLKLKTHNYPIEYFGSTIELHEDNNQYKLKGIKSDGRTEIFNVKLDSEKVYKVGGPQQYDQIRVDDRLYYFVLDNNSRDDFHEALATAISTLQSSTNPRTNSNQSTGRYEIPETFNKEQNLLCNIQQLSDSIQAGDETEASTNVKNVFTKLSVHKENIGIRCKSENESDEHLIDIRVQIDNFDDDISRKPWTVNVYPSTTINQLRAVFTNAFDWPLSKQCIFVNAHLAHGTSTMDDLDAKNDPLFVLLLLPEDSN